MTLTEAQIYHVERVRARLASVDVKQAFETLFDWASDRNDLHVLPISRGAFSSIHVSTRKDPRPYADCEMGFKGAKGHLRWYFRRPGFSNGLFSERQVSATFDADKNNKAGEMMTNILSGEEAQRVIGFVEECLSKRL